MQSIKSFFQKFLSFLRIRASAAGLEVSDQVLRFVYSDRGGWKTEAVRLAPGVLSKGAIKDAAAFAAALQELRSHLPFAKKKRKKMNVVVSLSSVNMYSQVFTLPLMEGDDLDKAINLNVQMVSPVDISHVYYGWQLLGRDEVNLRSDIAAAFVDKKIVDAMTEALYAAGFITVSVESRALALVRILREKGTGVDMDKSYLVLDIDNAGIDFLIVRKGMLYFEYANQWADLTDEKGQIATKKFEEMLAASLRQVMNFYTQHWPDPLAGILLSAVAFHKEAVQAIGTSALLPVFTPTFLTVQPVPPEWFVAFGCALRGSNANLEDKEINLSGEEALDTFHEEQLLNFMNLWRVLVPAILGFLIIVLFLADSFLNTVRSGIESQAAFTQQGKESSEVAALEASSTAFNRSVALVSGAEAEISRNYLMIDDINNTAAANGVTVSHISFQAANTPILVAGTAQSTDQIVAFKNAVQSDHHFGAVTLPLLGIQQDTQGGYAFSMTFPLSSGF
ncbi:MAG: hypothetical protein ABR884_03440 [Minisyncoccia bacterium]|jgi:hypothetical protein